MIQAQTLGEFDFQGMYTILLKHRWGMGIGTESHRLTVTWLDWGMSAF